MKFFKELYAKFLRKSANIILKKFPIFYLSAQEYFQACRTLERNFAGIVLGHPLPGVVIKIISLKNDSSLADAKSVPLGYFGEIVYFQNKQPWCRTELCGFADQRGRIWCCGDIDDIVEYDNEAFFPSCIEPVFENLFFVKKASLTSGANGKPALKIRLKGIFRCKIFRKYCQRSLRKFANRFAKTKQLGKFVLE